MSTRRKEQLDNLQRAKDRACAAIDARRDELIGIATTVLQNPETGYREAKTSDLVASWLGKQGLSARRGVAITGIVATLDTGRPGPNVAVIGELDSLIVPGHLNADPATGAAHACGHHIQIGNMLGTATGLLEPQVRDALSGRVTLMAPPAEEGVEIEYRMSLREQGMIEFLSGKQEFVRLGEFDHIDLAMMTHAAGVEPGEAAGFGTARLNGNLKKSIRFLGKAAHAGARPEEGINALNAATLALNALHAQRETFRDTDNVRVHPIITRGGSAVNSVPSDVRMETYVRASNLDALRDANRKVDRAMRSGAVAMGAKVEITTLPGTLQSSWHPGLDALWRQNAYSLVGPGGIRPELFVGGSTDMADLSHLMPAIHPFVHAASGTLHGIDFLVGDYELAVIGSAKAMAMTVIDLLIEGGLRASEMCQEFRPAMSKAAYLELLRSFATRRSFDESKG